MASLSGHPPPHYTHSRVSKSFIETAFCLLKVRTDKMAIFILFLASQVECNSSTSSSVVSATHDTPHLLRVHTHTLNPLSSHITNARHHNCDYDFRHIYMAYLEVHSRAVLSCRALSVLSNWAISGTNGSSGLGSVNKEQMESSTLLMVSAGLH